MSRIGRKRLALDVPLWLHTEITRLAKARNISLTRWCTRALAKEMNYQNQATRYYSEPSKIRD